MQLDFTYAQPEFETLKQESRCDQDIVDWLHQHQEVFRDANGSTYAQVRIVEFWSQTRATRDGESIQYELHLCLVYTLDATSTLLPPDMPRPLALRGWHKLFFDAAEWLYVVANFAPHVMLGNFTGFTERALVTVWDRVFPNFPWTKVLDFQDAGLLDMQYVELKQWVLRHCAADITANLWLPDSLAEC